jgi:hypothetical protein
MITKRKQYKPMRWISVADRIPKYEEPVWGLVRANSACFRLAIVMRGDGEEGWIWHVCTDWNYTGMISWPELGQAADFECDDDYQVKYWLPLSALPKPPKDVS